MKHAITTTNLDKPCMLSNTLALALTNVKFIPV